MLKIIKKYPRAFALAVAGHIFIAVLFAVSFEYTHVPQVEPEVDVVQATAVDESQVQAELEKLQRMEEKKRNEEQARVDKLEREADRARKAREKEQQRLAELEQQRKDEAKRKRELEKERKQAEADTKKATEQKRKIEAEQRKAAEAKRVAEQQAEEARRKLEAERQRADEERKRAEEIARKAREDAARALEEQRRAEEEQLRQRLLAEELQREDAARAKQQQSVIDQHIALIRQRIERRWIIPPTAKNGMKCKVRLRILPSGDVIDVTIAQSSGDKIFDRSVETAVRQSSPLPLPADQALRSAFRDITLEFEPKG